MYMFAYGMNTNKNQMAVRCPAAIAIGAGVIAGYEFRFAGCADIVPSSHSEVHGVLWKITNQCLDALDALEGYPRFYNRKIICVKHKNQFYDALVYFMNLGQISWPPSNGYFETVVEGYTSFNVPLRQVDRAMDSFALSHK
jgi:gamma-glutamylcyclotransferase (GGCT)/AIG2-like uncharacterized protein YtfP